MPIVWRYLLARYLKVFLLSVVSFVTVLVVARLDAIAEFAGLGASARVVFLFTLHQVPYILPIAIPVSCLIASILLVQELSSSQELTALRACSFSLFKIISPLLFAAMCLSIINFYVTSELATHSHLASRRLINQVTTVNPLLLLQKKRLFQLQEAFVHIERLHGNDRADRVAIAKSTGEDDQLFLFLADHLRTGEGKIFGENIAMVSSAKASLPDTFAPLFIENEAYLEADTRECLQLLRGGGWRLNADHLRYGLLLARRESDRHRLEEAIAQGASADEIGKRRAALAKTYSEGYRRLSMTLAPFTFTLLGATFGIRIGRGRSNRGIIAVVLLAAFSLAIFFMAKSLDKQALLSATLYLTPHLCIVLASMWVLRRASKGIE